MDKKASLHRYRVLEFGPNGIRYVKDVLTVGFHPALVESIGPEAAISFTAAEIGPSIPGCGVAVVYASSRNDCRYTVEVVDKEDSSNFIG